MPYIGCRHRDVFGEAAIAIDADDLRERTYVRVSGSAKKTAAIYDVPLRGDAIAFPDVGDQPSDLHDFPGKLVADHDRRLAAALRPPIPVVEGNVSSTNAGPPPPN